MIRECYETAKSKGWWDGDRNAPERVPELLCLIHSEVSEALECYRNKEAFLHFDITKTGNYPKPEGIASELADVLIRCFDMAGGMGIPLAEALKMKMEYNTGAPLQARRQGVLGL